MGNEFILEKAKPFKKGWETGYREFAFRTLFDRSCPPLATTNLFVSDTSGIAPGDHLCGVPNEGGEIVVSKEDRVITTWTNAPADIAAAAREHGALILEVNRVHKVSHSADFSVLPVPNDH